MCKGMIGFILGHKYQPMVSGIDRTPLENGKEQIEQWNIIVCPRCGDWIDPWENEEPEEK